MTQHRTPRRRSVFGCLALAAVLGLVTIGISQCRLVDDSITGVNLRAPQGFDSKTTCVQDCNDAYKAAMKAEEDRHENALHACGTDQACRRSENLLHKANED